MGWDWDPTGSQPGLVVYIIILQVRCLLGTNKGLGHSWPSEMGIYIYNTCTSNSFCTVDGPELNGRAPTAYIISVGGNYASPNPYILIIRLNGIIIHVYSCTIAGLQPLYKGGGRRLFFHQRCHRPFRPKAPRQDGELLPGRDTEVLLPAFLCRHSFALPGSLGDQHRGPSPANLDGLLPLVVSRCAFCRRDLISGYINFVPEVFVSSIEELFILVLY